jgi:diacylglycerol kinase family enzyme
VKDGALDGIKRIEVVANCASGSVGRTAPAEVEQILAEVGLTATIHAPERDGLADSLRAAVAAKPDLLVVLAGDGTARTAAELCGPAGPMIAPLPGGTMNMLPHAIYGLRPWQEALRLALTSGVERPIGGGEVDGHRFMVAAILGPPALWAPAREAARFRMGRKAIRSARLALGRAFSGRLRYILDAGPREKAEALIFMCPLTSKALSEDEDTLEAAGVDVNNAAEAIRLGIHALTGDWRTAPNVDVDRCKIARVWSANPIPALLDGELVRLKALTDIRYIPKLARVLALPKDLV